MPQHILLCDDEPHILGAARYKLAAAGYEVECAADGEEGWQAMCRRRPDLLITDCNMPRLSGLELLERMRATPALAALHPGPFDASHLRALGEEAARQRDHWQEVALRLLAAWREGGGSAARQAALALLAEG